MKLCNAFLFVFYVQIVARCIKISRTREGKSVSHNNFFVLWDFLAFEDEKEKQVSSSGNVRITYPGKRKSLYKLCFILNTFNIIWSIIWMKSFSVSHADLALRYKAPNKWKNFLWTRRKEGKERDLVNETFLLNYLQHISSLFLV